ncbi:MAG: hypothetical protein V3V70_07070 [Candidatus Scalindua sp.]
MDTFDALMEESSKRQLSDDETSTSGHNSKRISPQQGIVVLLTSKDVNIAKVNPMKLNNALINLIGDVQKVFLLNDSVKIICSEDQAKMLKKEKKLCGFRVQCQTQEVRIFGKGIIHGVHKDITEKSIVKALQVEKADRHTRFNREKGEREQTTSVILYFKDTQLPERVFLGFQSFKVQQFINSPIRCFKCQRFGHIADRCRNSLRCSKCGGNHQYSDCTREDPECVSCGQMHSAAYRGCPVYRAEFEVQRYRVQNKVSYAEAAKVVKTSQVPSQQSSGPSDLAQSGQVPLTAPTEQRIQSIVQHVVKEVVQDVVQDVVDNTQLGCKKLYAQIAAFVLKIVGIIQDNMFWTKARMVRIKCVTDVANAIFSMDLTSDSVYEMYKLDKL